MKMHKFLDLELIFSEDLEEILKEIDCISKSGDGKGYLAEKLEGVYNNFYIYLVYQNMQEKSKTVYLKAHTIENLLHLRQNWAIVGEKERYFFFKVMGNFFIEKGESCFIEIKMGPKKERLNFKYAISFDPFSTDRFYETKDFIQKLYKHYNYCHSIKPHATVASKMVYSLISLPLEYGKKYEKKELFNNFVNSTKKSILKKANLDDVLGIDFGKYSNLIRLLPENLKDIVIKSLLKGKEKR